VLPKFSQRVLLKEELAKERERERKGGEETDSAII
jgi:hypothetical protein